MSDVVQLLKRPFAGFPRDYWILWTAELLNRIGYVVHPFLSTYLFRQGISLPQIGILISLTGAGLICAQFLGGMMADRVGRVNTIAIGMALNAVMVLAVMVASWFPALMIACFLLGISDDLHRPASSALVADLIGQRDRSRANGLRFWATNLGFALAMVLGGYLSTTNFRALFIVDAATCVVFALVVKTFLNNRGAAHDSSLQVGKFLEVFKDRIMLIFVGLILLKTIVALQAMSTFPIAMGRAGLQPSDYGLVMALNGVIIVAIQPFVGDRLAAYDNNRLLAVGALLLGTGFGATAFATNIRGFALAVIIWTGGEIVAAGAALSVVADLAPPHLRGRYNGFFGMAYAVGWFVAPVLGTSLLTLGRHPLWLVCFALCAISAVGQWAIADRIRARATAVARQLPSPR